MHPGSMMSYTKVILRREHFGGLLLNTGTGERTILDPEGFGAKRRELESHRQDDPPILMFDPRDRGFPIREDALSSPLDIYMELTRECNLSCSHCYVASDREADDRRHLSLREIADIIGQFSDVGGFYVRLTGGEPTIRADFFEILQMIREHRLTVGLNTNGVFGEKTLEHILSFGVKDLRVSLDGPEKVNDRIRGRGTFRKVIDTLENVARHNRSNPDPVDQTINVVLMQANMNSVDEMIDLALEYGAKVSFGLLRLSGKARKTDMLSPDEVVRASMKVERRRRALGLTHDRVRINYDIFHETVPESGFRPFPFDNARCPIGAIGLSIETSGRVAPCGYLVFDRKERWLGEDIKCRDLLDVWHNSRVLNESRKIKRPGCLGCPYHVVKCNGGCPMMAFVVTGDIDGRDPYCVRDICPEVNNAENTRAAADDV